MKETPLWLNLLLSGPNPGRWKLVQETVRHALPKDEGANVYVSPEESAAARAFFDRDRFSIGEWEVRAGRVAFSEPLAADRANLLVHGLPAFPDELLDGLVGGFRSSAFEMGRIATQVHCGWCSEHEEARAWFDGAIHFSDLVLLDSREAVPEQWVRDYQARFQRQRYPCLFDLVRKGLPKHPEWFFDSQPRRLSLVFDPDDLSGLEPDPLADEDEDEARDAEPPGDPYLRRNAAGERERPLRPLPFALDAGVGNEPS